jgi:multimeric flavodoxin WrbA
MIIVGLPYAFAGLTNMDEVTGGSPYGATTLAKADGSHQAQRQRARRRTLPGQACRADRGEAGPQSIKEMPAEAHFCNKFVHRINTL